MPEPPGRSNHPPPDQPYWSQPPELPDHPPRKMAAKRRLSGWQIAGIVLATIFAGASLLIVALIVFWIISMNSLFSNK
ncbi:MAG TPA: hypothetical protein VIL34_21200 [Actinopolymorphaceae bacterium]|jgi:hypothetical protein